MLYGEVPEPPEFHRIRWEWGDGETNTILFSNSAGHTDQVSGDYEVVVTLETDALDPEVAHATIGVDTVQVRGAVPVWQITAIQDQDQLIDLGIDGESGEVLDLLKRLLIAPASGVISIEEEGTARLLKLRVLPSSVWEDPACCPIARRPEELQLPLGVQPTEPVVVGPHFAGWNFNGWSQESRDLSIRSMTGQVILGTTTYDIKDVAVQVGPRLGVRFAATRNGTAMTGTITFTAWFVDFETEELNSPPETFVCPFSAVRIR